MCTIASERANVRRVLAISVKDISLHSSSDFPDSPDSTRLPFFYSQSEVFLLAVRNISIRSQKTFCLQVETIFEP